MKFHVYPEVPELHTSNIKIERNHGRPYEPGFEYIKNHCANDCDYFIVPARIKFSIEDDCILHHFNQLEHFQKHPDKHIFFCTQDHSRPLRNLAQQSIVFQSSVTRGDRRVLCLCHNPWVSVPTQITPISQSHLLASFQGNLQWPLRKEMAKLQNKDIIIRDTGDHWRRENIEDQLSYVELLHQSKFVLCPRGNGIGTIRFFEALAFGRIPVLISDCEVPLPHLIDYKSSVVFVPESDVASSVDHIKHFLSDHDLEATSVKCREIWERHSSKPRFEQFIRDAIHHERPKSRNKSWLGL